MRKYTEFVFILDESGSMYHLTDDTIGGFNSMIDKNKCNENNALVTTVFFNDKNRIVVDRERISKVRQLTRLDYQPGGSTALLDAIGDTVHHIEDVHRYIRKEDVPEKTVFVITTDGMENASHKYSSDEIKEMIESKKNKGWEFVFVGADIDVVETARDIGIKENRAIRYYANERGTRGLYDAVSDLVCSMSVPDVDFDNAVSDFRSHIEDEIKD